MSIPIIINKILKRGGYNINGNNNKCASHFMYLAYSNKICVFSIGSWFQSYICFARNIN